MPAISRRAAISGASLTVAAGVVATALPTAAEAAPVKAAPLQQQVIARVTNLATGEVELFVGEREVVVRNPTLAHAIAHAAQTHVV